MPGMIFTLVVLFLLAYVVFSAAYIIHTREAGVIERLGKFHKIAAPGLNFKIPIVDQLRQRINLQVQQRVVEVETKTKDNVFVSIPVAIQFQVVEGKERDAFYALTNPIQQIDSYVQDTVRTSLASMNLDKAFESKDDIAKYVEETLSEKMGTYGWSIINTLVTDIRPDERVRASMNEINAAQRQREAAISLAEAEKIKLVKNAEGEAEAKRLQGEGIANERKAIVEGLASQIATLQSVGLDPAAAENLLILTQYFDTFKDVSKNSNASVMFMPSNPGGVTNFSEEIRNNLLSVQELGNNKRKIVKPVDDRTI